MEAIVKHPKTDLLVHTIERDMETGQFYFDINGDFYKDLGVCFLDASKDLDRIFKDSANHSPEARIVEPGSFCNAH